MHSWMLKKDELPRRLQLVEVEVEVEEAGCPASFLAHPSGFEPETSRVTTSGALPVGLRVHGDGGEAAEATSFPRRRTPMELNHGPPNPKAWCSTAELGVQKRKNPASTMAHRVFSVTCVGAVP